MPAELSLAAEIAIAVSAIIGASTAVIAVVIKIAMPAKRLIDRVDDLDERSKRDYEARQEQAHCNKAHTKALIALLMHGIDDNSTGKMESALTELQQYLIER